MIDALFSQTNYVATKRMLDATALRHEAIASNIANLETPGYKRVDVSASFTDELKRAAGARDVNRMSHMRPSVELDTTAVGANRDGNNVNLEHELLQLNQNAVAHTVETQLITSSLLKLRLAITGRPA